MRTAQCGAMWLLAMLTVAQGAMAQTAKAPLSAQDVRPPADILLDCAKAPKEAVTKLPEELARWATVYCTKFGHIFNANDHFVGAFPDSGQRASFSAAAIEDKPGEPGNDAFFSAIQYRRLSPGEVAALIALDPSVHKVLDGRALWRLDLTAANKTLSFIAIDPETDFFWVFPLDVKGLSTPAFYVAALDALNKVR